MIEENKLIGAAAMEYYIFESPLILSVSGADARRYLNARLSNDINSISDNRALGAAILNAQGKTEGYFYVLQQEDGFRLYCTAGIPEQVTGAFKRFLVADRVSVAIEQEQCLLYAHAAPEEIEALLQCAAPEHRFALSRSDRITLIRSDRLGPSGFDILCNQAEQARLLTLFARNGATELSENEFERLRLRHGEPAYPQELNESYIFSESELQHSVSFSKGCYVGQEALEMLAARGKLPARVARIQSREGIFTAGGTVYEDTGQQTRIGTVLSAAAGEEADTCYGFARIKTAKIDLPVVYTESGIPCTITVRTGP